MVVDTESQSWHPIATFLAGDVAVSAAGEGTA